MEGFPILEMPEEIQALVVERVASNSIKDLYNLRASCKSMKALTERRRVYNFFDLLSSWEAPMPISLFPTCYAEGNPSTLYMKGVQFFFTFELRDEGLTLMKSAADAGYERAVYAYAMIRKIFWNEEEYFARFTRESAARVGELVRSVKWGWGLWHGDDFRSKKLEFISSVMPSFSSCQCCAVVDINWFSLWTIETSKGDNMCDRCFWIKEVALFFRDFEPMSLIMDTSKW